MGMMSSKSSSISNSRPTRSKLSSYLLEMWPVVVVTGVIAGLAYIALNFPR
jgi:hypothetical protein